MKVLILGASGKTGRHVVEQALRKGHEVTALVRSPEKLDITHPKLRVIVGNAKEPKDLAKAFRGQEAVISTLGNSRKNPDPNLIRESSRIIVAAAKQARGSRVIMMSSFIVGGRLGPLTKGLVRLLMRKYTTDVRAGEELLRSSGLTWTIVYATVLTDAPKTGNVHIVSHEHTLSMRQKVSRADVAEFILRVLEEDQYPKQSVIITG